MDKPTKDTPSEAYLEHSAFTTAAVAADPEVAGLEADLGVQHVDLKQQTRAREDGRETVQRRRAVLVQKDRRCDGVVRSFELRLFDFVNKKRTDPDYVRYFADGLREVTEANMRTAEPQKVKTIIKSLGEDAAKPGLDALSAELKPQLEAAVIEVEAAEKALSEIESDVAYLNDKTIPAIEAKWTDEYVKLHGALKVRFPRDPARVESYFYPFKKERKKSDPSGGGEGGDQGGGKPTG
jgi:hypothetical protein